MIYLLAVISPVIILIFFLVIRTLIIKAPDISQSDSKEDYQLPEGALERFSSLLQCKTISDLDYDNFPMEEFRAFERILQESFPLVHSTMEKTKTSDLGMLFHWRGQNSDRKPVLFMAHYDVVPVEESKWTVPPFSGLIKEGYIWGRGSMDIKQQLVSMMEAAEQLIKNGFQPPQDIWFAFGGDEEVLSREGAMKNAEYFRERGIVFDCIMDEGGVIIEDQLKQLVPKPLALPGIAEKGFISLKLTCNGLAGHASSPPKEMAVTDLSKALIQLHKRAPKSRWTKITRTMFRTMAPHAPFLQRMILGNLWLFGGLLKHILMGKPRSAALFHTTQAFTILAAGQQDNVLPSQASAVINYRILPGETSDELVQRVKKITGKYNVTVELLDKDSCNEAVPTGNIDSIRYKAMKESVARICPEAVTVPFLMTACTDSKYFADLSDLIIRFTAVFVDSDNLGRVHAADERLSVDNYSMLVEFFTDYFQKG